MDEDNTPVINDEKHLGPFIEIEMDPPDVKNATTGLASKYTERLNDNDDNLKAAIQTLLDKINEAMITQVYPEINATPQVIIAPAENGQPPTRTDGTPMEDGDLWFEVITDTPVSSNDEE